MPASRRRLATAALAIGVALPAGAIGAPALAKLHGVPVGRQVPDITDEAFLVGAAQANRFEIRTGRLAGNRARARAVRSLGKMFLADHTAALARSAPVASRLGITPPPGLTREQQSTYDRLRGLRGRRFDRAWIRAQRKAHAQALALHLRGALNGDTADVRRLSILTLPVVSEHLGELRMMGR